MSDITEEQVVGWIRARLKDHPELKLNCITVQVHTSHWGWFVHGLAGCEHSNTFDGAIDALSKLSPSNVAEKKRNEAAALLKEADELEAAK